MNLSTIISLTETLSENSLRGLFSGILCIVLLIMLLLLYFQFLGRGIELFVLKMGLPIAAVGLLDSDKGVFAGYIKKFFMIGFTVVVQIALTKITLLLIFSGNLINAIAMIGIALKTPKLLNEWLITAGGSGGVNSALMNTSKVLELRKQITNYSNAKSSYTSNATSAAANIPK